MYSIAFSNVGKKKTIASKGGDKMVKIWNVENGNEIRNLCGHNVVLSVAFSNNGKILASGS